LIPFSPSLPDFAKSKPVRSYEIGDYVGILVKSPKTLSESKGVSLGMVQYLYALFVCNKFSTKMHLIVTAELTGEMFKGMIKDATGLDQTEEPFLCIFDSSGAHLNLGSSPDWSDIDIFSEHALKITCEKLKIKTLPKLSLTIPDKPIQKTDHKELAAKANKSNKICERKRSFAVAYILNFVIVGSGFLIVEGKRGVAKAFCWFISFILLSTFRADIGMIWALLIMIGSFIHLARTIREITGNRPNKIYAATGAIKPLLDIYCLNDDGIIDDKVYSDDHLIAYVYGIITSNIHYMGTKDPTESGQILIDSFNEIFKDKGVSLICYCNTKIASNDPIFKTSIFTALKDMESLASGTVSPANFRPAILDHLQKNYR